MGSNSIPEVCPLCGNSLGHVNAVDLCKHYFVWCRNSRCRWCLLLEFSSIKVNNVGLYYSYYRKNGGGSLSSEKKEKKYPTHTGEVQKKVGDNEYKKIGESAVWVYNESFMAGVLTVEASEVTPDENGKLKIRFMARR